MELHTNATRQVVTCSLLALQRRGRPIVSARKVPKRLGHSLGRPQWHKDQEKKCLAIRSSSAEAKAEALSEEAVHSVPHLKPDDRVFPWDDDRPRVQKWLQRSLQYLTKKAWIAALALFYLYNEAVAKLPWVKIKRFEKWFWTTVRCRWVHAMNAATVLGRQWWRDTMKSLNWRDTAARLAQKKEDMEGEMQENVEHVKHDIEESVEQQKDMVNSNMPARVNPLLIKDNIQERMSSAMEASGLGNHVDAAMGKLKDAVPMLRSNDAVSKAEAEAEAKAAAEAEAAEQRANASASAASPGIVNLPVETQISLPCIVANVTSASAKSSAAADSSAGKRKGEKKGASPGQTKSFLPLFWRGKAGKEEGQSEERPEEVESNGRKWPLPLLFWK